MQFSFKDYHKYPNKVFVIDHYHPSDPNMQKVWLQCVNDQAVSIQHYVNIDELQIIV